MLIDTNLLHLQGKYPIELIQAKMYDLTKNYFKNYDLGEITDNILALPQILEELDKRNMIN